MKKEDIVKIEFAIYDGERSEIPSVYLDEKIKIKSFGYGDCFGHDGKAFWLDLNQQLRNFDDEVEEKDLQSYEIIRKVIRDNF